MRNLQKVYCKKKLLVYEDYLKNFEFQHKDGITRQSYSGTTIVHALKDTCENCSYFCCLTVICASPCQCFCKNEKS